MRREASAVLLLVGVWSCGGSGDSGRAQVDTGLPEATQLKDVTTAQMESACENLQSSIESRITVTLTERRTCEMMGAFLTDNATDCKTMMDACLEQEGGAEGLASPEDLDVAEGLDCAGGIADFSGCNVTVGEYEDCVSAQLTQVEALFNGFSCANAGTLSMADFDVAGTLSTPTSAPSCDRLAAECPAAAPFAAEE